MLTRTQHKKQSYVKYYEVGMFDTTFFQSHMSTLEYLQIVTPNSNTTSTYT